MESLPPITSVSPTKAGAGPQTPARIEIGQVLKALVAQGTPTGATGGPATLRIGTQELVVRAQMSLLTGTTLSVRVDQITPQTQFAMLRTTLPPSESLAPFIKTLLPKQDGLPNLFAALQAVMHARTDAKIPAQIRQQILQLINTLRTPEQASQADKLRTAFTQSGVFLETTLAKGDSAQIHANLPRDVKAALLRLASTLERALNTTATTERPSGAWPGAEKNAPPAPPGRGGAQAQARASLPDLRQLSPERLLAGLRQMTEGALARVQLHQLASVETVQQGDTRWYSEIALRHADAVDVIPLMIEKDEKHSTDKTQEQMPWSATLSLDLPGLGPMQVKIRVQNQQVSSVFITQRDDTAATIAQALPRLREAFERRELQVQHLSCTQQEPTPHTTRAGQRQTLLDTQA